MFRHSLAVALVALTAMAAFSMAAAVIEDPGSSLEETGQETDLERADYPPLPPERDRCLLCGSGGLSGVLAGLVPRLTTGELVVIGAGGAIVLAVLWWRAGSGEERPATDEPTPSATGPAATGRHEGEPPDRTSGAIAPANGVYRAWAALADRVGVTTPASVTPREVADRAIDAGYDREAVETLTSVFTQVRYGSAPPTEERERRARAALETVSVPADEAA